MDFTDENSKRNNQSRTSEEPYSVERLDALKKIIFHFYENELPKFYSIFIDGEMVVPRTDDPEKFDTYKVFMEPHTQMVEVRTFFKTSPNCKIYQFKLRETYKGSLNGLGAVEVNEKIEQALKQQKLETTIMMLEKDKSFLEEQILGLKKKLKGFKKLQAQLDEKQLDLGDLLTKGMQLYGVVKGQGVPALDGQVQGLPQSEQPVEIEKETSEADQKFEALKSEYSEKQLTKAINAFELFAKHPELREEFQELITSKINQNE